MFISGLLGLAGERYMYRLCFPDNVALREVVNVTGTLTKNTDLPIRASARVDLYILGS